MKLLILSVYLVSIILVSSSNNLCSKFRTQSKYVNLGESGILKIADKKGNETMHVCGMELISCSYCQIELKVDNNLSLNFCSNLSNNETEENCPCGTILIQDLEKHYHTCFRADFVYKSTARTLSFSYMYNQSLHTLNDSISIIYGAQKNQQFIKGELGDSGIFQSPSFPLNYNMDLDVEYILSCVSGDDCRISLIFSDFLLSSLSVMEFFDSDGKMIQFVSGSKIRPSYMVSTSSTMFVRFSSNGGYSFRYKAKYSFTSSKSTDSINTNCGGELMDMGGNIYMNNITGHYDCFWIVKPLMSLSYLKTHIYLKILTFVGNGTLIIRNGETSNSEIIANINENVTQQEYTTTLSKGFYISYNGEVFNNSKIVFSYAAFSVGNCLPIDYTCSNKRCILSTLVCNSIDHCGDNSDEDINCTGYLTSNVHKFWWPSRDVNQDNDFKLTVGLWICGLIFIGTTSFVVINSCKKTNENTTTNNDLIIANEQIQTITQLIDMGDTGEYDAPPVYEPPPDYNQALKFSYQKLESNGSICDGENSSISCFDYQVRSDSSDNKN